MSWGLNRTANLLRRRRTIARYATKVIFHNHRAVQNALCVKNRNYQKVTGLFYGSSFFTVKNVLHIIPFSVKIFNAVVSKMQFVRIQVVKYSVAYRTSKHVIGMLIFITVFVTHVFLKKKIHIKIARDPKQQTCLLAFTWILEGWWFKTEVIFYQLKPFGNQNICRSLSDRTDPFPKCRLEYFAAFVDNVVIQQYCRSEPTLSYRQAMQRKRIRNG